MSIGTIALPSVLLVASRGVVTDVTSCAVGSVHVTGSLLLDGRSSGGGGGASLSPRMPTATGAQRQSAPCSSR